MIQMYLIDAGYIAEIAASAEEALARPDATDYDVVVSDVHMGQMNGFAFLKELRSRRADQNTILMTDDPLTIAEAQKAGISGFIAKPFKAKDLVQKIAEILGDG